MKQSSLDHFQESLNRWLAQQYIRHITLDRKGVVTITFMDGVKDTYRIADCDRAQIKRVCARLSSQGIPVREIS